MKHMKQPGQLQSVQAALYEGYTQSVNHVRMMPKIALFGAMAVVAMSGILPHDVLAAIPTADTEVLPDAVDGGDALTRGVQTATIGFRVVFGFLTILALVVPISAMIKAYRERKNNDNDNLNSTVLGGLIIMVMGMGLSILGFTYSGGLAAQLLTLG